MSTDERVAKDLVQTLEDGKNGFAQAAERLKGDERADLAARFNELSSERAAMSDRLQEIAAAYGDDIPERGTAAAGAHRAWMSLKDAVTGSDEDAVLNTVVQGEEHAVEQYREALAETDLSPEFRTVLTEQAAKVDAALAYVKGLAPSS